MGRWIDRMISRHLLDLGRIKPSFFRVIIIISFRPFLFFFIFISSLKENKI